MPKTPPSRRETAPNNLKRLRRENNLSQEQVAEAIDLSYSMVSRYERGESKLGEAVLTKFASFFRVPTDAILNVESQLSTTLIKGAAETGKWAMGVEWAQKDWYSISSPQSKKFPGLPRFGLEMRGPAMNLIYPAGAILICVRMNHLRGHRLVPGDRVIVDRVRELDDLHEIGCWEYRRDPGGLEWFWPRSDDPAYQTPLPYARDTVTVLALVVAHFREE